MRKRSSLLECTLYVRQLLKEGYVVLYVKRSHYEDVYKLSKNSSSKIVRFIHNGWIIVE